jgi:hypothetical protein
MEVIYTCNEMKSDVALKPITSSLPYWKYCDNLYWLSWYLIAMARELHEYNYKYVIKKLRESNNV